MIGPDQDLATYSIMHNKYPIDTLRLLKSNYKYKRRPPFDEQMPSGQTTAAAAAADLPHQLLRNLHQNVHLQIFSLIYQLILMFINLMMPQQQQQQHHVIDGNAWSNYALIQRFQCKIQSVLSYYATQQPAAAAKQPRQSVNFVNWPLCARWLSNISLVSMLSAVLAKLRAAAACTLKSTSSAATTTTAATTTCTSKRHSMLKFHKGISVNLLVMTLFMALLASSIHTAAGGACWKAALDNGKCSEIFSMNITRSDCCRISSEFSYTERELTNVEFFFATAIGGGMECAPCVESCKSVKCGANKKCVKRKGRPKCICAPDCGAARRRKQQQKQAQLLQEQHHSRRFASGTSVFAKSPRDIRSLSSEINNYNLDLDEFSLLLQQQQQQQQQQKLTNVAEPGAAAADVAAAVSAEVDKNQRKMHILQSQSQQKPAHMQKQRRLVVIANVEPTTGAAAKRRLQILSNVEGRTAGAAGRGGGGGGNRGSGGGGGGKRARNKHADNGERRHVGVERTSPLMETTNRRATMSRHYQSESNELPTASKPQQQEEHNARRRHRHQQKQKQKQQQQQQQAEELANLRHIENAPNNKNEEQSKHEIAGNAARKRKHKHQQQHQRRRHKQHKIKDHMQTNDMHNNKTITNLESRNTITTTTIRSNLTLVTAATTPANSTTSAIDKHLNIVNHGSNFATSSLSSLSAATALQTQAPAPAASTPVAATNARSTLLLSGVDVPDNNNDDKQDHDHVAGMAGVLDGNSAAVSSNSVNTNHDMTFLDGVFDQYNLHGFPNQQYSITHSEHFHGSHPVCGTDGRTYHTECQLKKRACRTNNANLHVAYRGYCKSSCHGVKCLHGLTCVEDNYKIPHCISCNIQCPYGDDTADAGHTNELHIHNYQRIVGGKQLKSNADFDESRAVCGVDGKTYKSVCDINRMICKIGRAIAVAYPGPCRADIRTCQDINCGPKNTCLVDYLTHQPRCISCRYKCSRKRRPMSLRYEEGKICGVNNRTYNSWCEMRKDSCSTGYFIDVRAGGECSSA